QAVAELEAVGGDHVVARPAVERRAGLAAVERVVRVAAVDAHGVGPAGEPVVAGPAEDDHAADRVGRAAERLVDDVVFAVAAAERLARATPAAVDFVVAGGAVDRDGVRPA